MCQRSSARMPHLRYLHNIAQDKKNSLKKKKQEEKNEAQRNKEKEIAKTIKNKMETVGSLKTQLHIEEENYKKCIEESESMQSVLKSTVTTVESKVVLKELVASLENIRNKEKDQKNKVIKIKIRKKKV